LKILKKIHGRVQILGWSRKQHGTFSGSQLLADSKNVHVLYVWRSHLTVKLKKVKICEILLKVTTKHTKNAHFWNQRAIFHQKKYHVAF
jgi:hypothetical protein